MKHGVENNAQNALLFVDYNLLHFTVWLWSDSGLALKITFIILF